MKNNKINIIGKTTDGKLIIDNIFRFIGTYGIPMDILFEILESQNMIPDWEYFYSDAKKEGWSERTFFTRLENAICDVYGKEFSNVILNKLRGMGLHGVVV